MGRTRPLFTGSGPAPTLVMNPGPSESPSSSQEPPGAHSRGRPCGPGGSREPSLRLSQAVGGRTLWLPSWSLLGPLVGVRPRLSDCRGVRRCVRQPGGGGGGGVEASRALNSGVLFKVDCEGTAGASGGLGGARGIVESGLVGQPVGKLGPSHGGRSSEVPRPAGRPRSPPTRASDVHSDVFVADGMDGGLGWGGLQRPEGPGCGARGAGSRHRS